MSNGKCAPDIPRCSASVRKWSACAGWPISSLIKTRASLQMCSLQSEATEKQVFTRSRRSARRRSWRHMRATWPDSWLCSCTRTGSSPAKLLHCCLALTFRGRLSRFPALMTRTWGLTCRRLRLCDKDSSRSMATHDFRGSCGRYRRNHQASFHPASAVAVGNEAYCTPQAWSYVLNELGQSEAHLRDRRYDAVIHLVTAANGAEKFYTLEQAEGAGASARTETLDEARQQDQKTVQAWVGHEHFYVLENNTNFERKINRAVDRVLKAIGEPVTGHCLRKIRLPYNKVSNIVEAANAAGVQQCQVFRCATTYISDSSRVRMRSDLDGKGASFYMQLFDEDMQSGRRRRQRETKIDSRDYIRQMKDAHNSGYNTVEKELVCFHWNGVIYEVNIFHWPEEVCILEVEAESHNEQIHVPSFLEAVGAQEVTHDRSYDTRAIARRASREMLSSRPS
mmetsp:Transcript_7940/g.13739  ORF Transcript_7940/g.13739 Transcript_7940/m.13739 type:complete len:452 (+) Transcript_7940:1502-2857(+)